jgi:hypothetical protein
LFNLNFIIGWWCLTCNWLVVILVIDMMGGICKLFFIHLLFFLENYVILLNSFFTNHIDIGLSI